jgi:glycosyltransferase involved in cell wall biosynthesis
MPAMPGLRRTVARADALFAANRETAAVLRRAGAGPMPLFADVGVPTAILPPRPPRRVEEGRFVVLWAGRIEHRKALPLCLEVARLVRTDRIRFLIVGDGPRRRHCEAYARRLGLGERASFLGQLSWLGLQEVIGEAHLFLFTSLRDTLGAVVLEATAKGCPILCLDHNGVGAHLPDAAAVKVGLAAPRRVAAALAEAIDALAADPQRRRAMSQAAFDFANSQRWDDRAARMEECYREVLARHDAAPAPVSARRAGAEWRVS